MEITTNIILGDSREQLKLLPDNSVDLIVTSPPYADQRKRTYGGIHPDNYVEWFLPISEQLLRVLKPQGTFILNIKEKVVNGERSTYVMELILAMKKQGWFWTEEFIWHKKNSYPGKWPNRFRDSWERLLQFNKSKHFNMYQEEVMVPMGDWAKTRLKKLSDTDKKRDNSKVGSGFGKIFLIGWIEIKHIQQMYCIWLPNVITRIIVPLFLRS
jgi:site-specific DNA-methyltransferase (adenine-specific)